MQADSLLLWDSLQLNDAATGPAAAAAAGDGLLLAPQPLG